MTRRRCRAAPALLALAVCGLTGAGSADAGAAPGAFALPHGVTLTVLPVAPEAPGRHVVRVVIEQGADAYQLESVVKAGGPAGAVEAQRAATRWREPYLLVGVLRGGWRESLDVVFLLERGRLRHLGEVEAASYSGGGFRDTYDKLEQNELTSRAGAPVLPLILEVREGRLRVNLAKTWAESERRFQENFATIRDMMRRVTVSPAELRELADMVVFNAVLARYCERPDALEATLDTRALSAADMKTLQAMLARVVPGELPRPAVKVAQRR
ncbi:MAG: hypothetical protein ACE147_18410, partial [Candidatus Methylomirabilales bacterium]